MTTASFFPHCPGDYNPSPPLPLTLDSPPPDTLCFPLSPISFESNSFHHQCQEFPCWSVKNSPTCAVMKNSTFLVRFFFILLAAGLLSSPFQLDGASCSSSPPVPVSIPTPCWIHTLCEQESFLFSRDLRIPSQRSFCQIPALFLTRCSLTRSLF